MTLAKFYSAAVYGVDAYQVEIEVNGAGGDPAIVVGGGLPDTAVKESRDRVTTAVANSDIIGRVAGPPSRICGRAVCKRFGVLCIRTRVRRRFESRRLRVSRESYSCS